MTIRGYQFGVERLNERLGGGYVAYAPELTGCLADGETPDEALRNLEDAVACWLEAARENGSSLPMPQVMAHA